MAIAVSGHVKFVVALSLLLSVLGSAACGTSQVITNDPSARIFANGQLIGRGHGEITQRGTSESTSIVVRSDDGREQMTYVKRRVTGFTLIAALFTYGTCLIFCWEYPDTILALLPARAAAAPAEPGTPAQDPWLFPPAGWWSGRSATPPSEPPVSAR